MSLKGKSVFWVVALLGTLLDLASKALVFRLVREHGGHIPVIEGFFYLAVAENPGGVFGLFADYGGVLMLVRAVALFIIVWFLLRTDRDHRLCIWAFGCLFAGALGNLYDNLFNHGRVRDWLQFFLLPPGRWEFPTFNVADILINVGVGLLLLHEFRIHRERRTVGAA